MEKITSLVKKVVEALCLMLTIAEELMDSNPFKVVVFILCLHYAPGWLGLTNNFWGLLFNNLFFQFALYLGVFMAVELLGFCLERLANFFSDRVILPGTLTAQNIPEKAPQISDQHREFTSTSLAKISES